MTMQEMQDRMEIRELTDIFANLADVKDVEGQGRLFLEDGVLEFQMGTEGKLMKFAADRLLWRRSAIR